MTLTYLMLRESVTGASDFARSAIPDGPVETFRARPDRAPGATTLRLFCRTFAVANRDRGIA